MLPVSLPSLTMLTVSLREPLTGWISKPMVHPALFAQPTCTMCDVVSHKPLRAIRVPTICVTCGALNACTSRAFFAHLANVLKLQDWYGTHTLYNLHGLRIGKLYFRGPYRTDDMCPVVVDCLLQRLAWLRRSVFFCFLRLTAVGLRGIPLRFFLRGFLFVRALVVRIVLLRLGVRIMRRGAEDAFIGLVVRLEYIPNSSIRHIPSTPEDFYHLHTSRKPTCWRPLLPLDHSTSCEQSSCSHGM
jgi:hypothetical protein